MVGEAKWAGAGYGMRFARCAVMNASMRAQYCGVLSPRPGRHEIWKRKLCGVKVLNPPAHITWLCFALVQVHPPPNLPQP